MLSREATMAKVTGTTLVSPPLMHVFRSAHAAGDATQKIDMRTEAGERIVAGRRGRARQMITEGILRSEVAHDLAVLLNTIALGSTVDVGEADYVRKSILNFGLPDLSRDTIDEVGAKRIHEEIKTAIVNYEPRLVATSLQIERDRSVDKAELRVRFIVHADLTCEPVHVPVEFVADLVDTGKIVVNRL